MIKKIPRGLLRDFIYKDDEISEILGDFFTIAERVMNDIKSNKISITYRRKSDLMWRDISINAMKSAGYIALSVGK